MIRVNHAVIDEDQVAKEMQYHPAASQRQAMIAASEALIIGELLKQRADTLGLALAETDAEKATELRIQSLIDREVDVPRASEEDCRTYFSNNPDKFSTSPLLSLRHILLAAAPDDEVARSQLREKAEEMLELLQQEPQRFSALAASHSRCSSAREGGVLGQVSKGQTVAEFERQVFPCQPGLIASPIETRYGIHIVMVDARVEGRALEYHMVADKIAAYLNEKVKRKAVAHYIEQLIGSADIEGFDFSAGGSPLMQ